MKTRRLVSILILILAVLIILGNCATKQVAISEEEAMDALLGTWTNTEYGMSKYMQKLVYTPEGKVLMYTSITSTEPVYRFNYIIHESWKDRKGNIWYKIDVSSAPERWHNLVKINNSVTTLEYIFLGPREWPTEIDPNHLNYRIYYRQ